MPRPATASSIGRPGVPGGSWRASPRPSGLGPRSVVARRQNAARPSSGPSTPPASAMHAPASAGVASHPATAIVAPSGSPASVSARASATLRTSTPSTRFGKRKPLPGVASAPATEPGAATTVAVRSSTRSQVRAAPGGSPGRASTIARTSQAKPSSEAAPVAATRSAAPGSTRSSSAVGTPATETARRLPYAFSAISSTSDAERSASVPVPVARIAVGGREGAPRAQAIRSTTSSSPQCRPAAMQDSPRVSPKWATRTTGTGSPAAAAKTPRMRPSPVPGSSCGWRWATPQSVPGASRRTASRRQKAAAAPTGSSTGTCAGAGEPVPSRPGPAGAGPLHVSRICGTVSQPRIAMDRPASDGSPARRLAALTPTMGSPSTSAGKSPGVSRSAAVAAPPPTAGAPVAEGAALPGPPADPSSASGRDAVQARAVTATAAARTRASPRAATAGRGSSARIAASPSPSGRESPSSARRPSRSRSASTGPLAAARAARRRGTSQPASGPSRSTMVPATASAAAPGAPRAVGTSTPARPAVARASASG